MQNTLLKVKTWVMMLAGRFVREEKGAVNLIRLAVDILLCIAVLILLWIAFKDAVQPLPKSPPFPVAPTDLGTPIASGSYH